MSQINVEDSDKDWFDEFKESGETQAEAFSRLVDHAKAYNGDLVDPEEVAEITADKMSPKLELVLYRVAEELNDGE